MIIRRAEEKDIPGILKLLSQVLEVHAAIRPDYFISGTTKFTADELAEMVKDENKPIYVAAEEDGSVLGHLFCEIKEPIPSNNVVPFRSIYIHDLCVDEKVRCHHVGKQLLEFIREKAREMGCYEITLNVWEGNDIARAFYEKAGFKPLKTTLELIL